MAGYYQGGYDSDRLGHGHGHGRQAAYSNTDECYEGDRRRPAAYAGDDCGGYGQSVYSEDYAMGDRRRPAAYAEDDCGGYGHAVYSDEYARGAGGEQGYYKKEEKMHKNRERMGEVGALATGAFAMYEGYEAKKDPAHAQRHKIEAGLAGAAALGAGGYAYHEHRGQKAASNMWQRN